MGSIIGLKTDQKQTIIGGGSEMPAAHTQQKLAQVAPPGTEQPLDVDNYLLS